ncbi:MAG TPA: LamG domain-containing protein [Patescibacteria group bacterium]
MARTLVAQVRGNAAVFNGSNGNGIQRSIVADGNTGDYTASAWIYISVVPSGKVTLIKNGQTGNGNGGWNFVLNASSQLEVNDPGGVWGGSGTTVLSTLTWYHVAFIRTGTNTQMYLNGVAEGAVITGTFNSPQVDTTVGCTHNTTSNTYTNVFNGYIDDARIYTRALSTAELLQIYGNNPQNNPSTSNLVLWYKFDETTGATTVVDSSVAGNTGTIQGTVTFITGTVWITNIPARTVAGTRTLA